MSTTDKKTNERKKPKLVGAVVLVVLLLVGVGVGIYWLNETVNFVSTDDASIDADHVTISAKMLGRIKSLEVDERDHVVTGQLLVLLDDADLKAQEASANASLKYALQNMKLAQVNLEKARDDFERSKTLYNSGVQTREQYNHASKALETASVQYSLSQAQADTSRAQLGIIETQLLNTRITAPISGVIAKKSVMPGDVIQPGQSIFTINDLSEIWVTANFEETKVRHIHMGSEVDITIDAYPGNVYKGHVVRIAAGIVPPAFSIGDFTKTTQRVPVRIQIDSSVEGLILLPGMSVEVKVKSSANGKR